VEGRDSRRRQQEDREGSARVGRSRSISACRESVGRKERGEREFKGGRETNEPRRTVLV
jgi:hypothetical protein